MSQFHFISTDIFPQTLFFRMVWNWHSRYNDLVLWYRNIPLLPLKTMHKSGNVNASCHKGGNVNTSCISPYWSPFDSCGYCTSRDTSINIEGIIIYSFAPDTHDRQNILSHFKLFKYWGGVDAGFHPQMCFMWSFYRLVFLFCDQLEKHATFYCSFAFVSCHNSNKERSSYLQELFIQWACFCRA